MGIEENFLRVRTERDEAQEQLLRYADVVLELQEALEYFVSKVENDCTIDIVAYDDVLELSHRALKRVGTHNEPS